MGLFDLFKGKSKPEPAATGAAVDKNVARLGRVAADKHAQNYDRIEAIEGLARVHTGEAAAALLKRFTFHIDPSITDQEEKDAAFRGVLAAGDDAIEPIRAFCAKAESLSWPLKILKELVPAERYQTEVIQLLARFDADYVRNTDPKQQLIVELEHHPTPESRVAVERYLEDVSDQIRFSAVTSTFAHEDPASTGPLAKALIADESVRVKMRIAEGLAQRAWPVSDELRDELRRALPAGFGVGVDGVVVRR